MLLAFVFSVVEYLYQCYKENESIFEAIQGVIKQLPYQVCKDNDRKAVSLISLPCETSFAYEEIIDPEELSKVEQQVQKRKSEFELNIKSISDLLDYLSPTFESITQIKRSSEQQLAKMEEVKNTKLSAIFADLLFALSVFNDSQQDEYIRKHKPWLKEIETEVDRKFDFDIDEFVEKNVKTEILIKPTTELLKKDVAFNFLPYQEKLRTKRQEFIQGVSTLESTLDKINRLPKEKSEAFREKMSTLLNVSLIPIGNIVVLFPINGMIKEFQPALKSNNSFYVSLKQDLLKKFKVFLYPHLAAILISGGVSFAVPADFQPFLYALAGSYAISSAVIFFTESKLKKL